ncbi:DUF2797 domain-containing protein [Arthrobacter gandavensis]|uniref:DUF2797 domain-containing protein n=1 Tax=Arthrobacter gandavensis TaxID=169960 RepID=UPI001890AC99|nr:DUF2797 domain-containing protein [Arthrobacter gandavensis]MBF4993950.1 DUF2797 domain-containing protein [Arthrobacter gandavensis]
MTNALYLCGGTAWDGDGAFLRLFQPGGRSTLRLASGTQLRFRIRSEAPRYCLGYELLGEEGRTARPCPGNAPAERGNQCRRCFFQDEGRLVHNSHRGGDLPAGLKNYLARPQWLYIATFADGTTKVGTAADRRKVLRLTEQGALAAQYVARAANGQQVRVLEDGISGTLGLPQAVRAGHKCAALAAPLPCEELEAINANHADAARAVLIDRNPEGFDVVKETWQRPEAFDAVLEEKAPAPYPLALATGEHGLVLRGMLGSTALAATDDAGLCFLADLTALKGQRIEFGDFRTELPALQQPLF